MTFKAVQLDLSGSGKGKDSAAAGQEGRALVSEKGLTGLFRRVTIDRSVSVSAVDKRGQRFLVEDQNS